MCDMDMIVDGIVTADVVFAGADDNRLCGNETASLGKATGTALLLHGGGQTRHSWQGTAKALAVRDWRAVTIDQRGHGESDWSKTGDYSIDAYAGDLTAVLHHLKRELDTAPVVIGASLGGLAGLLAAAADDRSMQALVLVDVTPHLKTDGVERILGFMAASAECGFDSLQEAADTIAAYLPHRPRPSGLSGLAKNLRLDGDGRYRWHWDPRFLSSRGDAREYADVTRAMIVEAARQLRLPVLLIRGRESELVGEQEARQFVELVPHARVSDVSGARHMVAGDRNDVFTAAVLKFLETL